MSHNSTVARISLPDSDLVEGYAQAALKSVLSAVNDAVFPGYWSVCADGQGFGYGNTYPSLDGHQMTDALLWLGQERTVKLNWDYVRGFQRANGQLPLAILPGNAAQEIGPEPTRARVDDNGGLYTHWVAGDPLRALAGPTFIQNADSIFRHTQDLPWLRTQLPAVNLAADYLATLITPEGVVGGAGYYVERPVRVEFDGVAQCYVADALKRVSALNHVAGNTPSAQRYNLLATRVAEQFSQRFWTGSQFAEYIHPQHGRIDRHGLTDTDWAALAMNMATAAQRDILWPRMRAEAAFYYGGMPTGISTRPETYEAWEFTHPDRHDLAAMGRVWFLECWARANFEDGDGIAETLRRVCAVGRENGWFWRERYYPGEKLTPAGPEGYCEYASNLIRIVQRFLFGVEFTLQGGVILAPNVPEDYWRSGFGQSLHWRSQVLTYRMDASGITGTLQVPETTGTTSQRLTVRFPSELRQENLNATIDGKSAAVQIDASSVTLELAGPRAEFQIQFRPR